MKKLLVIAVLIFWNSLGVIGQSLVQKKKICFGSSQTLIADNPQATHYQWYKNGAPIIGASSATLTITDTGVYTATCSIGQGCYSDFSINSIIEYFNPVVTNDTLLDMQPASLNVLQNDSFFCNVTSVQFYIVQAPINGSVVVSGNFLDYTPYVSGSGRDSFAYAVKDANGLLSNVAWVYIGLDNPLSWNNLLRLDLLVRKQSIIVEWSSSHNLNASGYKLWRSSNGRDWSLVYTISNIPSQQSYHFEDRNRRPGQHYYKVSWTDNNGLTEWSEIKMVTIRQSELIAVFPNPAKDRLIVSVAENVIKRIRLFTLEGVVSIDKICNEGIIVLDIAHLPANTYAIEVEDSSKNILRTTFVKTK